MIGIKLWAKALTRAVSSAGGLLTRSSASAAAGGGTTGSFDDVTSRSTTEFTAEVVRVTQVLPHPNADRLEIIRFEMRGIGETTYEVVSQKGTFQPGDLAAYFSVDCLLPTKHPDFRFLLDRLDGKGKDVYRLRAARLRGTFSQGLLVNLPFESGCDLEDNYWRDYYHEFGQDVAAEFGVTYHRPEEPGSPTAPSGKKAKKQPFPIYGVESLKKVPRLFEEGERVCVTEKIHGTNFRFGWVRRKVLGIPFGWKFVVGSHRVIKNEGDGGWYGEDLWSNFAGRHFLAEAVSDYKDHIFFGEIYGKTESGQKIQDLTYGKNIPHLAIFDIIDDEGEYVDIWTRQNICADLGLQHVPVLSQSAGLSTMEFNLERVKELAEGKSVIAPHQIREGCVVESTSGPRRKAKYVGQGYLMRSEA